MAANPIPYLSEDAYLAIERAAETKSEYHHGQMFAMSGGTNSHSRIGVNVCAEFRQALRGRGCGVTNSDLRLRIPKKGSYVYPDMMISCDEADSRSQSDSAENPILIAEVLSPSTELYDRGVKFGLYKTVESCREYLLISQSEPLVELFSRQLGGWLLTEARGVDASIRIESLGCEIPLAGIYENVTFLEPPPDSDPKA